MSKKFWKFQILVLNKSLLQNKVSGDLCLTLLELIFLYDRHELFENGEFKKHKI